MKIFENLDIDDLENEIWKDILDYDGDYQASNIGRVKSLKFRKERILRQHKCGYYFQVNLFKNGECKPKYIHQLVFEAHSNCKLEEDCDVHHTNENKENNYYYNLIMIPKSEHRKFHHTGKPRSEETKKKISESNKGKIFSEESKRKMSKNHANVKGKNNPMFGISRFGENNPNHKLTEEQIIQIKLLLKEGQLTQQEIANIFGVSQITISRIKNNTCWTNIE